jgi:hypothetical protein
MVDSKWQIHYSSEKRRTARLEPEAVEWMPTAKTELNRNRHEFLQISGVILILLILRIPALTGAVNLHTDATEYIDIARNISAGEGPVLKIRAYFFNDGFTLPHPAAPLRSILFPLLMGGFYRLFQSNLVFQWFNFGIFFINILLFALILRRVLPFWAVVYSLLLIGLCEPVFLTSIFPGAEQIALLWLLAAILMASLEIHRRWGLWGAAAEGIATAFAAMSRPEYVLVGVLFLGWLWIREKRIAPCASFLAGFLIPLSALYAWNFHQYGRLFITSDYLFRSRHYKSYFSLETANEHGAGRFFLTNSLWIAGKILRNAANYTGKLIGWKNLFILAAALPLVLRNIFRDPSWRKQHLALVPAAFFVSYCLVWSTLDRERFLIAITPFWLPLCLLEVNHWRLNSRRKWIRIAAVIMMSVNLPLFLANVIYADFKIQNRTGFGDRFYASEDSTWSNPDVPALADWIRANTDRNEIFCFENPFLANYLTGRPSLLLPENVIPADFLPLLKSYKVRYWVNNPVYTNRTTRLLRELREIVRNKGAKQIAQCGTYEVWLIARE